MHLRERERKVLEDALAAFTGATGFHTAILAREPQAAGGHHPDAVIEIGDPGKPVQLFVEIRPVDRAVALATAKQRLEAFGKRGVLVTRYMTAELATQCRTRLDLQFIDTAGNAYLRARDLLGHGTSLRERPGPAVRARPARPRTGMHWGRQRLRWLA